MTSEVKIRRERPDDCEVIGELITSAFLGMPYADGDEAGLVDVLRDQGALSVSLVAEVGDEIVGQIAFSPARAPDDPEGWYALGPVAVVPDRQRTGIGSTLVRAGLGAIAEVGAVGCILTGNPNYYARFGFELAPQNAPPGEPAEFFMIKLLNSPLPTGPIHFHGAFGGTS